MSYAVHACDVDLLHRVLREAFVRHPGLELPDPPKTGALDIRQVLDSPYFFA